MKKMILLCLSTWTIAACNQEAKLPVGDASTKSDILVTVNGDGISQAEVVLTTEKLFSKVNAQTFAKDIENKALESMVMMMALAQESESKANADELRVIDVKVKRYREELLTDIYLRKYADMLPPTESEIRDYYDRHPARFGKKEVRHFDIARAVTKPNETQLASVLAQLQDLRDRTDWLAAKNSSGLVEVLSSSSDVPQLDAKILSVAKQMAKGETSAVVYIDGKPLLLRINDVSKVDARPFVQVKESIRKTLSANKVKQQVKVLSAKILNNADVKYFNK